MLRQNLEAEGHEKLVANRLGVATQGIPIATRTRLVNKIYVAILSKYVATQSKNKPKEQVVTEDCILRQRPATRTKNSIAIELSMSRQSDQFGPEFWGSTMKLMK